MKKTNFMIISLLSIFLTIGLFNSPTTNNNLILKHLKETNNGNYNVSSYDDFKNALEDQGQTTKTITFENDIDLSQGNVSLNISSIYGNFITIDGGGFSIKNKPSNYYFTPVFDYFVISNSSETINSITFRNLTLDNVGSFIGYANVSSVYDYDLIPNFKIGNLLGKGLTFQNITIKNNIIENQDIELTNYYTPLSGGVENLSTMYKNFGFLANSILLSGSSFSELDQAVNFFNIHIENNMINNNTFKIVEKKQNDGSYSTTSSISESFLANLEFLSCSDATHNHHSYITYQNIYIDSNEFKNNTIQTGIVVDYNFIQQDFNSFVYETFGNLSGNLNGVLNSGLRNYLYINNIYISNNQINESKKENSDGSLIIGNYKYSELISNSNYDLYNQNLTIDSLKNIFIFNNESYYLNTDSEYQLINQKDINMINIEISKDSSNQTENILNSSNIENLFIYGLSYEENEDFNLLKNVTSSTINIYYGRYLYEDTKEFYIFIDLLNNLFGIYSYQINFDQIVEGDQTRNAFNSISKVSKEHIDIYYNNFIYAEDNSYIIEKYELKFKYYQPLNISNQNVINMVYDPYEITNLKLYNDQNQNKNIDKNEIIATSNQSFSIDKNNDYNVVLDLNNPIEITQEFVDNLDINNLYLGFDYSNNSTQKVSSSTILKIDSNQLQNTFSNGPLVPLDKGNSKAFIIIMSSVGVLILILLLLVLLITLIIFKIKKKTKNKKNTSKKLENNQVNNNLEYANQANQNYLNNQNLESNYQQQYSNSQENIEQNYYQEYSSSQENLKQDYYQEYSNSQENSEQNYYQEYFEENYYNNNSNYEFDYDENGEQSEISILD